MSPKSHRRHFFINYIAISDLHLYNQLKNSCHFNQMTAVDLLLSRNLAYFRVFSWTFADLFCKLNYISRNRYLDIAVDSSKGCVTCLHSLVDDSS